MREDLIFLGSVIFIHDSICCFTSVSSLLLCLPHPSSGFYFRCQEKKSTNHSLSPSAPKLYFSSADFPRAPLLLYNGATEMGSFYPGQPPPSLDKEEERGLHHPAQLPGWPKLRGFLKMKKVGAHCVTQWVQQGTLSVPVSRLPTSISGSQSWFHLRIT